jgi:acyl carrier protein
MDNLTTVDKNRILQCIFDTVDEMNDTLPDDRELGKSPDTRLIGKAGGLDSLEFVNFIVLLEQRVAEAFGTAVTLADERALSREKSPFSTIGRLTDYLTELLESRGND